MATAPAPSPGGGGTGMPGQPQPGFNELAQASKTHGTKVYKSAQKLADIGRKQSVGDGTSRAFVWTALGEAGIDANVGFGPLIWEQQGSTRSKRSDDIRPGDVLVLHDAKFKGKKGLVSYHQQVGSVDDPMFAICSEFEPKRSKVRGWQVDRGVSLVFCLLSSSRPNDFCTDHVVAPRVLCLDSVSSMRATVLKTCRVDLFG